MPKCQNWVQEKIFTEIAYFRGKEILHLLKCQELECHPKSVIDLKTRFFKENVNPNPVFHCLNSSFQIMSSKKFTFNFSDLFFFLHFSTFQICFYESVLIFQLFRFISLTSVFHFSTFHICFYEKCFHF